MGNKSTPPRSSYGKTGGGTNPAGSVNGAATNAASTDGKAQVSAKKLQRPTPVSSAKPRRGK